MKNTQDLFKKNNLKLTPQRYAIYNYLLSTKSHPSAETIYNDLKEDYPMLSLATVYKTLKTLTSIGAIQELNVGEDNFRYDANVESHPHITCIKCLRVDDMENIDFSIIDKMVQEKSDYIIKSHQLYFYGICKNCRED